MTLLGTLFMNATPSSRGDRSTHRRPHQQTNQRYSRKVPKRIETCRLIQTRTFPYLYLPVGTHTRAHYNPDRYWYTVLLWLTQEVAEVADEDAMLSQPGRGARSRRVRKELDPSLLGGDGGGGRERARASGGGGRWCKLDPTPRLEKRHAGFNKRFTTFSVNEREKRNLHSFNLNPAQARP